MLNSFPLVIAEKAMHEFCRQWLAGLQPCLSLETAPDGSIRVCSKVIAGSVATSHPHDAHHDHAEKAQKRKKGPSYHRRLRRREAARKAAAATDQKGAEKAVHVVLDEPAPSLVEAVHAFPTPRDELCPDKDYIPANDQHPQAQHHHDDHIPQLDGHDHTDAIEEQHQQEDQENWINPNPETGLWVCRCCQYAHSFLNEDDLKQHHDKLIFEYDECNICYPWHVWT